MAFFVIARPQAVAIHDFGWGAGALQYRALMGLREVSSAMRASRFPAKITAFI